ncbi:hypothetical protein BDR04DRAFT_1230802 [Suillus decipiens]|nr:hypothetical protein BDR04DRAFT_1230802 [Suillus decipiens]
MPMTSQCLNTCGEYCESATPAFQSFFGHNLNSSASPCNEPLPYMPLEILNVDPETFCRVEQSGRPFVVYECKLEGIPCGMFVEGTTSAVSAHLRRHGITGPDSANTSCPWSGCSKILRRGGMARHILTHLGVKVRCSVCRVVKCRLDLLRAHIRSSESCGSAHIDTVHGPEGRLLVPTGWTTAH